MYKKVPTNLDFVSREQETLAFWNENHIFEKSLEHRKGGRGYTFYDGPPTANGKPHIGHVLTRVIKDMIPRYRCMKGYDVPRKAGWDTHGLPVELEVEKLLGLDGKEQIETYGIDPFITKCKESVWKYKGMWEDFSGTVGFWADMDHPYVTYHNDYIESEWWALKKIWEKDLLYKGFKIVPYCPRCGTPLSTHEVAQGYKAVKERSAIARFKVKEEDAYILAWTTTPWTLPSNVALCVNPDEIYVKVKAADGYTYYLAKALADTVLGSLKTEDTPAYEILAEYKGTDLEYKEYEPLFECAIPVCEKQHKKAHYVTCDNYVTMSDGTGVVHIAPAFGADDANVGRKYDLPFVQFVDAKGDMTEETPFAGVFVKKADPMVLTDLDKRGLLFDAPKFEHEYPFCWRCDTPLIYYARESWFIKMTAVREDLIRNNNTINWIPESIGKGRFGDWLENVQDWGISRNRYWGTPLNIWECSCGHRHAIGSIAELKEMAIECPDEIELHRPYVDAVKLKCPECGGEMTRVPEVIDCWFDSGAMPFAQHHYPFENHEAFEAQFPADFISEAVDQTRGWFYTLEAISTLLFDRAPFQNCIVMGHVQDAEGRKMSKHLGNVVNPFEALDQYGADALRWYFYTTAAPWLPKRFSEEAVQEGQRKFMGTLWNTYAFWVLYADIDSFDPTKYNLKDCALTVMDRFILSRLHTTVAETDDHLANYRIPEAAKSLSTFVDELSNWYVRRGRERFWGKGMAGDKEAAFATLYHVLVTLSKVCAPFIPFMAEDIYQNLVVAKVPGAVDSVHLCDFPVADASRIDTDMEAQMDALVEAVQLGRACRAQANMKTRQPAAKLYVKGASFGADYQALCEDELNVKEVVFTDNTRDYTTYQLKPQMRTLGRKYGKLLGKIGQQLKVMDGNDVVEAFEAGQTVSFDIDGTTVTLESADVLTKPMQKPGFVAQEDRGVMVVLDTNLTPELIQEGYVREVISKIQTMRKDAGFEVTDRIDVRYTCGEKLAAAIASGLEMIKNGTLALTVEVGEADDSYTAQEWKINDQKAVVAIRKAQ